MMLFSHYSLPYKIAAIFMISDVTHICEVKYSPEWVSVNHKLDSNRSEIRLNFLFTKYVKKRTVTSKNSNLLKKCVTNKNRGALCSIYLNSNQN